MVALNAWLARIEDDTRLMRVTSLAVSALEPAAGPGAVERLRIELVVVAWRTLPARAS